MRILDHGKETGGSSALSLNKSLYFQHIHKSTEEAWTGSNITLSSILENLKGQ